MGSLEVSGHKGLGGPCRDKEIGSDLILFKKMIRPCLPRGAAGIKGVKKEAGDGKSSV